MITTQIFDSQLLPDGHLSCPREIAEKENIQFKILAIYEEPVREATDREIERAAIQDAPEDFLTQEELQYYMGLEEI